MADARPSAELTGAIVDLETRLHDERTRRRVLEDDLAAAQAELRARRVEDSRELREAAARVVLDASRTVDEVRAAVVVLRERLTVVRADQDAEREMVERRLQALRSDVERTLGRLRAELHAERARNAGAPPPSRPDPDPRDALPGARGRGPRIFESYPR